MGHGAQRVTVHKHAIGLESRICHRTRDSGSNGAGHAHLIDICGSDMAKADSSRHLGNLHREQLAARRRELFGIVDAPDARLHRKTHGTHGQGTRYRATAHLVDTHDNAITAELMHKLVHAVDALAFGKFLGMALKGTFASLDHLLARILAIMLHEGGDLLERGARQLAGNLRCRNRARHIGHTRPSLHANQIKRRATRR